MNIKALLVFGPGTSVPMDLSALWMYNLCKKTQLSNTFQCDRVTFVLLQITFFDDRDFQGCSCEAPQSSQTCVPTSTIATLPQWKMAAG